jgi:uncharacterized phiE125 gp8 family phage protein
MSDQLISTSGDEPVSLSEARLHLKLDDDISEDDALISGLISAVRAMAEHETGRALVTQTRQLTLEAFPSNGRIHFGFVPVGEVEKIEYLDADGDLVTIDPTKYRVFSFSMYRAWIEPAIGETWPSLHGQSNALRITYKAGVEDPASVPQSIKQWILLHVANFYQNRSASNDAKREPLPFIAGLLDPYRTYR